MVQPWFSHSFGASRERWDYSSHRANACLAHDSAPLACCPTRMHALARMHVPPALWLLVGRCLAGLHHTKQTKSPLQGEDARSSKRNAPRPACARRRLGLSYRVVRHCVSPGRGAPSLAQPAPIHRRSGACGGPRRFERCWEAEAPPAALSLHTLGGPTPTKPAMLKRRQRRGRRGASNGSACGRPPRRRGGPAARRAARLRARLALRCAAGSVRGSRRQRGQQKVSRGAPRAGRRARAGPTPRGRAAAAAGAAAAGNGEVQAWGLLSAGGRGKLSEQKAMGRVTLTGSGGTKATRVVRRHARPAPSREASLRVRTRFHASSSAAASAAAAAAPAAARAAPAALCARRRRASGVWRSSPCIPL